MFSVGKFPLNARHVRTLATGAGIKNITVIGSGLMGAGIVQVAAQSKLNVTMVDLSDNAIAKGKTIIETSLKRIAKKKFEGDDTSQKTFVQDVFSRISTSTDALAAAKSSDLVIEAIVENLQTKQTLFKALDGAAPPSTIFASNTSSLPIGDIASVTTRKDRFAGLHYFNPVPQMKLVEIIRTPETSDEVFNELYVGLDTIKFITDGWYASGKGLKGDKLVGPSSLLNEAVDQKAFGRKSGRGFYDYTKK
ncbi:hypothetical protein HDU96_002279 [Phlyctochytrium bullatum]|nr:hypothetical protein HDU96_002279 [Phlyctochytrium bullatum]